MMLTLEEIHANVVAGVYDVIGYIKQTNSVGLRTDLVKVWQVLEENGYTVAEFEAFKKGEYNEDAHQLDIFHSTFFLNRRLKQ